MPFTSSCLVMLVIVVLLKCPVWVALDTLKLDKMYSSIVGSPALTDTCISQLTTYSSGNIVEENWKWSKSQNIRMVVVDQ